MAKVLPCGSACRKKGPQVSSGTLGKEQSQLPEITQGLSVSLVWFSPWPDSVSVISDPWELNMSFPICCCFLLLVLLLVLADHETSQNYICHSTGQNLLTSACFCIHSVSRNTELPFLFYFWTSEKYLCGTVSWRTLQVSVSLSHRNGGYWYFLSSIYPETKNLMILLFFFCAKGLPWLCGQSSRWWIIIRGLLLEKKSPH